MITKFRGIHYFLSNFYPSKIQFEGISYPTVEHFYNAMKINKDQFIDNQYYSLFDLRYKISLIGDPSVIKSLCKNFKIRKDWDKVKQNYMLWALRDKFGNMDLKDQLLQTGDVKLVEGNTWHDNYWGVCSCGPCANTGQNILGKLLMQIRSELRNYENVQVNQQQIQNSSEESSLENFLFSNKENPK